jgi:hypothetical protein
MFREAAVLTASCVLFVQMGLSQAIQEKLHFQSAVLSCPKCCTFWSVLILSLVQRQGFVYSVAASFISSYVALWLVLIYDCLATIYNYLYDKITKKTDTDENSGSTDGSEASAADAVP